MWYVYILHCNDESYYTGVTDDFEERVKRHNQGKGAEYTRLRRPTKLIYYEVFPDKSEALKREVYIKKLSKNNKNHLIRYGRGISLVAKKV